MKYYRIKQHDMHTIVAAIIASFAFGLCHGTAIWIIYATTLGLVMTWVFEKYQSLTASILFHFSFNTMGLILNMIPESMRFVLWILLAVSVVGLVYGVKQMKKVTVVGVIWLCIGIIELIIAVTSKRDELKRK